MNLTTLVLATRNDHKTRELRSMLHDTGITVRDLSDFPQCPEVVEDGETLEENAVKKAREIHRVTGLPVLADDSGLEVHYLLGAPGVYSARYAGEGCTYRDNNRKLLQALNQVPARRRGARFRTVLALVHAQGCTLYQGMVEGSITFSPHGDNGFGYDPIFLPAGSSRTYAELTDVEKNQMSHRRRAVESFLHHLPSLLTS